MYFALAVITYINIVDLRLTARGQNLFVFATVASLLFLIIVAAVHTIKSTTLTLFYYDSVISS